MPPSEPDPAERHIHALLRALPDRAAPRALAPMVLAEIRRLDARPWWRRPYSFWPPALRGVFLLLCAAAVGALAAGPTRLFGALARHSESLASLQSLGASLGGSVRDVFHAIPAPWLYGAIGTVAACYAALAAVTALVYRMFFHSKLRLSRRLSA
jgi:hypothetical protein